MGNDYKKYGCEAYTWKVRLSRAKTGSLLDVYVPEDIANMLTDVGHDPTKEATMVALDLIGQWIDADFQGWYIIDIIPVV